MAGKNGKAALDNLGPFNVDKKRQLALRPRTRRRLERQPHGDHSIFIQDGHVVTGLKGRKLNVGAGGQEYKGWETMDVSPVYSPDFQHDMLDIPWPFEDEAFVELVCTHVLEHIEVKHRVAVMNEMWRILKPGGVLRIEVPVFPYWKAIADPTHVSFFVRQSFWYFVRQVFHGGDDYQMQRDLYGVRSWDMAQEARDDAGTILRVELIKPIPGSKPWQPKNARIIS